MHGGQHDGQPQPVAPPQPGVPDGEPADRGRGQVGAGDQPQRPPDEPPDQTEDDAREGRRGREVPGVDGAGVRAGDDAAPPAVVAVLPRERRQGVDFVITGGTTMTRSAAQARLYRGIDDVPKASGFTKVASAAGYDLYRLDACD